MRLALTLAALGFAVIAGAPLAQAPESIRRHGATLDDVFALRDIGGDVDPFLAVSPDGAEVAFFVREIQPLENDYIYHLALTNLQTGATRMLADAGRFVFRTDDGYRSGLGVDRIARFSPDGASVYYLAERDGRLNIRRVGIDGAVDEAITDAEGDVRGFDFDGDRLLFDTATPRAVAAAQAAEDRRVGFRIDENFRPAYALSRTVVETTGAKTWSYDPASGAIAQSSAVAAHGDRGDAVIRPLDPTTSVSEPALGVFYTGSEGDALRCPDIHCSGALDAGWRVDADEIVFVRREGHGLSLSAIYAWRPATGYVHTIRRGEERFWACAPAGADLICFHESALEPRRLVAINVTTGRLRPLYDPNPEWQAIRAPRLERLDFTDAEGNQSYAHLVYPLNYRRGRRYPLVIVQYHSRGFLRGGVGNETPILPLSARGYFVLSVDRPEFRIRAARLDWSALQRETELDGSERGAKREALLAFIDLAVARGADRRRMGITGLSDGAETVYAMLMDEPDLFAAAVVGSPPTDPASWPLQPSSYRDRSLARIGLTSPWVEGSPWTQWWIDNSASLNADLLRTPMLFNWAEAEAIRGFPLLARLHETGLAHEAYLYPNAYHLKYAPQQLRQVQERSILWLERWLNTSPP